MRRDSRQDVRRISTSLSTSLTSSCRFASRAAMPTPHPYLSNTICPSRGQPSDTHGLGLVVVGNNLRRHCIRQLPFPILTASYSSLSMLSRMVVGSISSGRLWFTISITLLSVWICFDLQQHKSPSFPSNPQQTCQSEAGKQKNKWQPGLDRPFRECPSTRNRWSRCSILQIA